MQRGGFDMTDMRTPLAKVRGLGSAREGTGHFWHQRLTAIANVPLVLFFIGFLISINGADYATVKAALRQSVRVADVRRSCCSPRSTTCGSACRSSSRTTSTARG